jgi:hypothetical protein
MILTRFPWKQKQTNRQTYNALFRSITVQKMAKCVTGRLVVLRLATPDDKQGEITGMAKQTVRENTAPMPRPVRPQQAVN